MVYKRGMWVWNSTQVLTNSTYQKTFFTNCQNAKITDVFIYMYTPWYATYITQLRNFISKATGLGMKVWALDGARSYFSDVSGPSGLYKGVNAMIAYNGKVNATERFCGFQTDNEPEDSSTDNAYAFHDDIPNSKLNANGGGKWKTTQVLDREYLMRDWLDTHNTLKTTLQNAGLLLGASLPSWLDSYYGEPLYCTWKDKKATVMQHFCGILDTYNIMSYQTNTNNVVSRILSTVQFGSSLKTSLLVFAGLETHKGRGAAVTYGDNPTKHYRSAVLADVAKLEQTLGKYSAFGGVNIHDYVGWAALAP